MSAAVAMKAFEPISTTSMEGSLKEKFDSYCFTEDITKLEDYIWHIDKKSNPEKFYCRIDHVILSDVLMNEFKYFQNIDEDADDSKFFLLLGSLLPSVTPGNPVLVKLAVPVNGWFFSLEEFPSSPPSIEGNFWAKDHEGTWYQTARPHEKYNFAHDDVYTSICHHLEGLSLSEPAQRKAVQLETAFICNREWDWVELDPFVSTSLIGIFVHGDLLLPQSGRSSRSKKVSIRIPVTEFIIDYKGENEMSVEFYSSAYKVWIQIVSLDSSYKEAFANFMQKSSLGHILANFSQRSSKYPEPVLPVLLDAIEDRQTLESVHKSLGHVDLNQTIRNADGSNPLPRYRARVRLQDRGGFLQAHFPVSEACVEVAKGRVGHSLLFVCPGVFLRMIHNKDDPETASSMSQEELQALISRYNWPTPEDSQIWRHITDFCCFQVDEADTGVPAKGNGTGSGKSKGSSVNTANMTAREAFHARMIPALQFTEEKKFKVMVLGKLLPPPPGSTPVPTPKKKNQLPPQVPQDKRPLFPLSVIVYAKKYSIDYGSSRADDNRGLWIEGATTDTWYKLIPPAYGPFAPLSENDFEMTKELLLLSDIVQDGENLDTLIDKATDKIVIPISVKEMYQRLDGSLNLTFLRDHADFALSNLDVLVSFEKSKEFKKSVLALKDEDFSSWVKPPKSGGRRASSGSSAAAKKAAVATAVNTTVATSVVAAASNSTENAVAASAADVEAAVSTTQAPIVAAKSTVAPSEPRLAGTKRPIADIETITASRQPSNPPEKVAKKDTTPPVPAPSATTSATSQATPPAPPSAIAAAKVHPTTSTSVPVAEVVDPNLPPKKIKKKERSAEELEKEEEVERMQHVKRLKDQEEKDKQLHSKEMAYSPCPYCRGLAKRPQCQNNFHEDGKLITLKRAFVTTSASDAPAQQHASHSDGNGNSAETGQKLDLCPFCKSLSKMPSCPLSIHADGEQLKRRSLNLGTDESHERRQYDKHHQSRLMFSGWSSPSPSASTASASSTSSQPSAASYTATKSLTNRFNNASSSDFQGRIVEASMPIVSQPSDVPASSVRSILKKTSAVVNATGSDEVAAGGDSRKQYLASLRQQRLSGRSATAPTSASNTTNTLMWQDETSDSERILGEYYSIERIDLSLIPRYVPSNDDRSDEEE